MNKKTIALIDDDPGILEVTQIILTDAGFDVLALDQAEKVVKTIKKNGQVCLIFLDIKISGHDGSEIAKQLKSDSKTRHIPIIILSASPETKEIAKKCGADDFLEKPFDLDELLEKVRNYVN